MCACHTLILCHVTQENWVSLCFDMREGLSQFPVDTNWTHKRIPQYTASSGTRNKHTKCEFIQTGLPSITEAPGEDSRRTKAQLILHLICWDWGQNPSIATNISWFLPSLSASFSCHSPFRLHLLSTWHLHLRSPLLEIPSELSASSNGGGEGTWKCLLLVGKPSSPSPHVMGWPQPTPNTLVLQLLPASVPGHTLFPSWNTLAVKWLKVFTQPSCLAQTAFPMQLSPFLPLLTWSEVDAPYTTSS